MNHTRSRLEEIFHEVADLSAEARSRYFAEHGVNSETLSQVEALLAFDSRSCTSLEQDIGQVAEQALAKFDRRGLQCGPYELRDLLGHGGMGSVYLAKRVDGELAQEVAVKLLRPGADHPALRQRFLAERQILATLSHPHIAKLLDAGHRDDGQPYLVIEYVRGKPIDAYTRGLTTRQTIGLFLKVCAAVTYLHRNLVVHRDLKPANILVTDDGEPKLLDFGIAKMLDLVADSTVTGMRMLTPDYASPEQVAGGSITTATDIYSLGAVLYKLLAGVSPHQCESDAPAGMALAIASGEITPPSRLAPELKGDLETILMKALRTEPAERYPSADALADDLRAYLEYRPIQARSGDVWYRTRTLLRHYWLPAAATALVILSLFTGLLIANRQRLIAERRFAQLRQLANKMIDFDRAIRTLPGSIEARRQLVAASLEYLEGLSREARGNFDLAQEVAEGYWRMARIQGVSAEFNLGDSASAENSLKKAEVLNEAVLASRPKDRVALFRSALIAHDRMLTAASEARRGDVVLHARKAAERLEAFLRDDSQTPIRLDGLMFPGASRASEHGNASRVYVNIAYEFVIMHQYEDGARCARRAVELAQSVPSAEMIVSQGLNVLADALRYQGQLDAALSTIRQAQVVSQRATYETETVRLFYLYALTFGEGLILGEPENVNLGRPAEAAIAFQKAVDMTEAAAARDSQDTASRTRLGEAALNLADLLRERDPRRAMALYDLGIRRLEEAPASVAARRIRAELLARSSYTLRRLHSSSEAKRRIDVAAVILREAKAYPAERIRLESAAHVLLAALADQEAAGGHLSRALEIYQELLQKVLAWPAEPETNLPDAVGLSLLYARVAELDRQTGRSETASTLEKQRLEIWQHWDSKLPNNSFIRGQLNAASQTWSFLPSLPVAAKPM
jgi:serine/threonine protein kinase